MLRLFTSKVAHFFKSSFQLSDHLTARTFEELVVQQSCFRVVQVSGADYADCNGLYSLTNMSSVWDTKHIVYSRLDTKAQERR